VVDFKALKLEKAKLNVKYNINNNTITVNTNKFLKNLFIDLKDGKYVKLSDNYFDLMPDQNVQITVEGDLKILKDDLQFKSYRESHIN
jgi:hypothetical protein